MRLLIKGMEMPKRCCDCPCREYPEFSFESNWCCLNQKTISDVKVISPNCPLVEIPTPHGDLIDRDYLLNHSKVLFNDTVINQQTVINAPAVIKKEE